MPDENTKNTDASDVMIKLVVSPWPWVTLILFLIVLSGWASPDNIGEVGEKLLRGWRCG